MRTCLLATRNGHNHLGRGVAAQRQPGLPPPRGPPPVERATGRELCAFACVIVSGDLGTELVVRRRLSCGGYSPIRRRLRVRARRPRPTASIVAGPQAGSASEAIGHLTGTFLAPSAGLSGMLPWPQCPASQRRSIWLEQASAGRALAVPMHRSSNASAATTTSSRSFTEPSVRSRRLSGAAG